MLNSFKRFIKIWGMRINGKWEVKKLVEVYIVISGQSPERELLQQ
jgi:hypothetical protein